MSLDAPGGSGACSILHVDMDAFYASVELIGRPQLRGRPMIVGGLGSRGVVLSATYPAREYGVRSGMPMGQARRLCPDAEVLPPDHRAYSRVSAAVMRIFASVTPAYEPLAFDEAFLDVSGAIRRLGSPWQIAEQIRARVQDEQSITCSVGIADTKFIAKLASTRAKPDGVIQVPRDRVVDFLHPLPIGAMWGVGSATEGELRRLGITTIADLAHTPRQTVARVLGRASAEQLCDLAWGRDPRRVTPHEPERSVGHEHTFDVDVEDPEVIRTELLRLSESVAARLRAKGLAGRTVVLKVRFADFTTLTRSRTLGSHTDVGREIYLVAEQLYAGLGLERARIRLIGVRAEGVADDDVAVRQLELGQPDRGWREAERAADQAVARFGDDAVRPARLLGGGEGRRNGPT